MFANQVFREREKRVPVMVSMSLVDDSGRTLSGQTVEAFYASIRHARPMTVGFNCGAGPEQMARYLERLSGIVECFTHAYPNAGLSLLTSSVYGTGWLSGSRAVSGTLPVR
eukprot:522981-Rhodomonas_salina.1